MKKVLKSRLLYFILGAIIFSKVGTAFAYSLAAENIAFTPVDNTWEVENASNAINSLYDEIASNITFINSAYYHDRNKATINYTATENCKLIAFGAGLSTYYGSGTSYSSVTTNGTYKVLVENLKLTSASTSHTYIYAYEIDLKASQTLTFSIWSNQGMTSNLAMLFKK